MEMALARHVVNARIHVTFFCRFLGPFVSCYSEWRNPRLGGVEQTMFHADRWSGLRLGADFLRGDFFFGGAAKAKAYIGFAQLLIAGHRGL